MAVNNPNGTDISVVSPVMISVPTMACQAPPPSPTTPRIDDVKNVGVHPGPAVLDTVHTTEISGSSTSDERAGHGRGGERSTAWRRPSTTRDTMPIATM